MERKKQIFNLNFFGRGIICFKIYPLSIVQGPLSIEDTAEVTEAKAAFAAAFSAAEADEHAALAPLNLDTQAPQIENAYIADTEEVAAAKAAFFAAFNAVKYTDQGFPEVKLQVLTSALLYLLMIVSRKIPSPLPLNVVDNDLVLTTTTI